MIELADLADNLRRVTVEVMDGGTSLGAGVLWPRGCVVTNAHVARRSVMAVRLVDGRRLEGRLLARDGSADLALLRVAGVELPWPGSGNRLRGRAAGRSRGVASTPRRRPCS